MKETSAIMTELGNERRIGAWVGQEPGPTVVAVGGVHGNEKGGVLAIRNVLRKLEASGVPIKGRFYGILGNRKALKMNQRYLDTDLNRMWKDEIILGREKADVAEYEEMLEIKAEIEGILEEVKGPITLLDLHSFSGDGAPFVIAEDDDLFEEVFKGLPFPIIFGLHQMIPGTLSNYMNCLGHRSMAIEGGQHNDPTTVPNLELFLWLFLLKRGYIDEAHAPDVLSEEWRRVTHMTAHLPRYIRVNYRHAIEQGDMFKMFPGFKSFTPIQEKDPLATDRHGIVYAPENGVILMPLYQGQGNDGFFIGQGIKL